MATLESCVGNTPVVDLSRLTSDLTGVRVLAKLEGNNPGGSVKDRAALGMFMGAESRGELKPGTRIIEPTSGNTGIALAMIAARRGYPLTLVMPESMTVERRAVMAAYGADMELTPAAAGMEGAIDRAHAMVADGQGHMFDQFSNPDNWRAHYRTTGPEIWDQTKGRITHFVSAMGTTGTIMGVSRALKERNRAVQIVGVQPDDSSSIPGIRRWPMEYLPKIFDPKHVDRVADVSEDEARDFTRRLAREEGIFAGHSAGGAVAAAVRLAQKLSDRQEPGIIVVILPDRGDKYLSTPLFETEGSPPN
ncbi:MAG: cysteine synthase CysM [Magnetococcales bacterium]|nr:cysteine synthase CysM [Magnetococcales bacterium]